MFTVLSKKAAAVVSKKYINVIFQNMKLLGMGQNLTRGLFGQTDLTRASFSRTQTNPCKILQNPNNPKLKFFEKYCLFFARSSQNWLKNGNFWPESDPSKYKKTRNQTQVTSKIKKPKTRPSPSLEITILLSDCTVNLGLFRGVMLAGTHTGMAISFYEKSC